MLNIVVAGMLAMSAPQERPVKLWRDVEFGMTREEVRAMFPEREPDPNRPGRTRSIAAHRTFQVELRRQPVYTGCDAIVEIYHEGQGHTVDRVQILSCGQAQARAALTARYGQPISERDYETTWGYTNRVTDKKHEVLWVSGDRLIKLVDNLIVYEPASQMVD